MLPVYMAKAGGFFFMVFGVTALMGALLSINPVWKFGPYDPSKVTAGSQPDWYMGWPDGALRIMPNWETHAWGHTISWNILLPIQILPVAMFSVVLLLPFLEAWITGDKREHHLLQRPRDAPARTAFMASLMTVYGLFWAAGGNDIIATHLHLSLNSITYFMRAAVFLLPPLVFVVVRRWCLGLQRADNDRLLHGYETGILMRSADGGYSERHQALSDDHAYALSARDRDVVVEPPPVADVNGVVAPRSRSTQVRSRLCALAVRRQRGEADPGGAGDRSTPRRARPPAGGGAPSSRRGSRARRPPAPRRRRRPLRRP